MHCGEASDLFILYVLIQVLYIWMVLAIENERFGFKNYKVL